MKYHVTACLTAVSLLGLNAAAQEKPGAVLQKKLEARYKGQQVNVVPAGVFVGIADLKGPSFFITDQDFSVHYDHFADGVEMPKRYQQRDHFDERTTQEVEATAVQYMSTTEAGETLEVVKLQMLRKGQQYMVDVLLRALASRHLSVRARQAQGATIVAKNDIGVHFRFYFPSEVAEQGDYDKMVQEIDRYLVPKAEYANLQKKAAEEASTPKTVALGQTPKEVESALGKPETIINLGTKTTWVYKNMKVIFIDGKVVDVQ